MAGGAGISFSITRPLPAATAAATRKKAASMMGTLRFVITGTPFRQVEILKAKINSLKWSKQAGVIADFDCRKPNTTGFYRQWFFSFDRDLNMLYLTSSVAA